MRTPWRFVADLVSRKQPAATPEAPEADIPLAEKLEYHPGAEETYPESEATPTEQSVEAERPEERDAEPAEADVDPKAAYATDEASSVSVEDSQLLPANASETQAISAPGQLEDPVAPEAEATPANIEVEETIVSTQKRRRKTVAVSEQAAAESRTTNEVPAVPVGPRPFIDEMTELGAEVDALRSELAKKLTEQNAQLRKLLARFDVR